MINKSLSRLFTVMLLAATSMTVQAAEYVRVSGGDGSATYFEVADKPTVTFTAANLVITSGAKTVEYPLTAYRMFEFTDRISTGISTTEATQQPVFRLGESISASGLTPGSILSVYTSDGSLVGKSQVSQNGEATISIGPKKGVYIVKTSSKTFKFIKR